MNPREKKQILNNLKETELRQDLIIPLLSKMGFNAPLEYHGPNEKGKDIICFYYDKLNEQRFLAVVAKSGDLTGNAATNTGLMNVVTQVQQAFDNPYEDLYNMRQIFINEVWVVTSGKIVAGAQESVINSLRKSNLDKQIRIIGDDRLITLIDKYFNTYWNSNLETKESVIIQRDRLLSFVEGLLQTNNVPKDIISSVKSSILYSNLDPRISKNIDGLHISYVSPFSIELAKIDLDYDDYIVSKVYGTTSSIFFEAKRKLTSSFYDIEETIELADKISKMTNPWEFVLESNNLKRDYPFEKSYGNASKFIDLIHDMEEGLNELKYFKSFLKFKDKLEWARELTKSIVRLQPEIENYLANCNEEQVVFNFLINEDLNCVEIEFNEKNKSICFKLEYKRVDIKGFHRNKDGSLNPNCVIEDALFEFRKYIENKLEYNPDQWLQEFVE